MLSKLTHSNKPIKINMTKTRLGLHFWNKMLQIFQMHFNTCKITFQPPFPNNVSILISICHLLLPFLALLFNFLLSK